MANRTDQRPEQHSLRTATPADVVKRLTDTSYEWTAVTALGWGMGGAQNNIAEAVNAAEAAGLVRTTFLRGKRMAQLAPRADRIRVLRESIARRALATIGTQADARILRVIRTGAVLTVATEQPDAYYPYAVDSFRLPIPAETDPEQVDPRNLGEWILTDQLGDFTVSAVDRMVRDASEYAAQIVSAVAA